jgi:sporulation protein YlmC with PRC-barrel domain
MSLQTDNIVGERSHGEGPGPEVMGASSLSGDSVVDRNGDSLGEIKEIMVDVPTGRVAYAVLSFGGFLGIADKLFAVPWSALTLDTEHKQFILDVDKNRLKDAPGFDMDHWPSMAQPTWACAVYKFYGVDPYWH